jgi:hypothetical protein
MVMPPEIVRPATRKAAARLRHRFRARLASGEKHSPSDRPGRDLRVVAGRIAA